MPRPATAMPSLYAHLRRRAAIYLAVVALFAAGTAAGALSVRDVSPQRREELTLYVRQVQQALDHRPEVAQLVRRATWEHGVRTVGLMWLLGLSLIGAPFILGVVFLRGFGLGFTAGFLVEEEGLLPGIVLTLAGVTPHHLFLVPGLLLAGGAALSFSAVAAAIILGKRQLSALSQFIATTLLCGLSFALLMAGTLVEAYMTPVLVKAVASVIDLW